MSRSISGKCHKKEIGLCDRISWLPDEVIVSILSFLPLKEAVATTILSSRWLHLWKLTTLLNFDAMEALMPIFKNFRSVKEENDKYVKWVNKILLSHKASTLEEFRVWFDLSNLYQNDIDNWLNIVLTKRVQRLELNFRSYGFGIRDFNDCYTFPFEFVSGSRGPPKLTNSGIYSCTFGCSESLRELSLASVNVTGEVIQNFLSYCPLLERLVVMGSGQLTNLEVSGPSLNLRHLEISHCNNLNFLKVCNTGIISLKADGTQGYLLLNNLSLVEVWLGYGSFVPALFPEPSSFLSQLEVLHLYTGRNATDVVLPNCPQLPRLKQLELTHYVYNNRSILGFSSLVKAAPCLQKFMMELNDLRELRVLTPGRVEERPSHQHDQLKRVELKGYFGAPNNFEVVLYFLLHAPSLEEIVIDPRTQILDPSLPLFGEFIQDTEAARNLAKQQVGSISHAVSRVKITIL